MRLRASFALLAIPLLVAACGGSSVPAKRTIKRDGQLAALRFSNCMRHNGVPGFSDPMDRHGVQFSVTPGEVNSPAFARAQRTCSSYLPGRPLPKGQPVTPGQVRFAACMRKHGLKQYPDPVANATGPAYMQQMTKAGINPKSPAYEAAAKACNSA